MMYSKEERQELINFLAEKYDNNREMDRPEIYKYLMNLVSKGCITNEQAIHLFDIIVG